MVLASSSDQMPELTERFERPLSLEDAILKTLAYVDIFDYPLKAGEIHRYLTQLEAPSATVKDALDNGCLVPQRLSHCDGYFTLSGREELVATRQRREKIARRLWSEALHYGSIMGRMPFVRMVAVTGSLAVNNAQEDADIDYLFVTRNDRLWICRALTILVVRAAARRNVALCPNYFLSERSLIFDDRNLYTAHELAQMVPICGLNVYQKMRKLNRWTARWLPNAMTAPPGPTGIDRPLTAANGNLTGITEKFLQGRIGARLERWEMERKIEKFGKETAGEHRDRDEVAFSPDWCKGHFDGHARRVLNAYAERLRTLEGSS